MIENLKDISSITSYINEEPGAALFYTAPFYKQAYSYFFKKPSYILEGYNYEEIEEVFEEVERLKQEDFKGYGIINYETGYLLESRLKALLTKPKYPLVRFCLFKKQETEIIKTTKLLFNQSVFSDINYELKKLRLNISKAAYLETINKIKDYIRKGDSYQVNFTLKTLFDFKGDISNFFFKMLFTQSAAYSAFINNQNDFILSLSPELFFKRTEGEVFCLPMKGTVKRGKNIIEDNKNRKFLFSSEKNRAENVMIVDLIRNDLSKLLKTGQVKAEKLFSIEKYETVFQMVSAVRAVSKDNISLKDIFLNLFPCGSVTGAPKLRTMEIINKYEKTTRGIYTGAIGIVSKEKDIFNVPIRTIIINKQTGKGEMGIGGGIVSDSNPEDEYNEAILKSQFLRNYTDYFVLFETMLVENNNVYLLNEHLKRLKKAAEFFLFNFDRKYIIKTINSFIEKQQTKKLVLKTELTKSGFLIIKQRKFDPPPRKVKIALSNTIMDSNNKFLYFKTSKRHWYSESFDIYKNKDIYDVVCFNEKGELTEATKCNIFIKKNNKWLTLSI
nr:aminodeoxychorismate synthase component I [Bacteroidales bacterium]